jgi:hypothetical protein
MIRNENITQERKHINDIMKLFTSSSSTSYTTSFSSTLSVSQERNTQVNQYAEIIADYVLEDEYIEGQISKSQLYMESLYNQDPDILRDSFQKAWLNIYSHGEYAVYTFISIASCLDYYWLKDRADTLIFAGYSHVSELVNEATIRAIESWEQPHHIALLKEMKPLEIKWLEDYKQNVTQYLETL